MNNHTRIIVLAVLACGTLLTGKAQGVYTLKSCLETGLLNNYSLRIVHNDEQISKNNATPANAGYLPTLDLTAGYQTSLENTSDKLRETGVTSKSTNVTDHTLDFGIDLNWTLFDGFNISTTYKQLQLMKEQGETNTRIAIEDFIAQLAAEYYNFVQQKIRLKNLYHATRLSKERLRIAELKRGVGSSSGLERLQAKVDFNADSTTYMKQQELLHTSRINLNELMANKDMDQPLFIQDTIIDINTSLNFKELWESMLSVNSSLLKADQNTLLAQMDYKKVLSRNYPYVKLNAGYGYTFNKYDVNTYSRRSNWGFNGGVTIGFNLFDGNRRRERKNASLAIKTARLQRDELEQGLRADLSNLWQAYRNNLQILNMERQNLILAQLNYETSMEGYKLGSTSGIEMREAQQSLLDAEERILSAEYDTKICEISLLQISGLIMKYLE